MDRMKLCACLVGFVFLIANSSLGQLPVENDTIKFVVVGGEDWQTLNEDTITVQILLSANEHEYISGTIPIAWSDTSIWKFETVHYGPVISGWSFVGYPDVAIANSIGLALVGGAGTAGEHFPLGSDQLWCELKFSLRPGVSWEFGDVLAIDTSSALGSPYDYLLLDESITQYTPAVGKRLHIPFLSGGKCSPGDVDGNSVVNIADVTTLIAYIFGGGVEPICGGIGG